MDDFDAYWLCRHGKIPQKRRFHKMEQAEKKPEYVIETFEPNKSWRPFKLINERRGVVCSILEEMSFSRIVREVLQDRTSPSNLAAMVRGERRSINGWRCEHL